VVLGAAPMQHARHRVGPGPPLRPSVLMLGNTALVVGGINPYRDLSDPELLDLIPFGTLSRF
jgi:hypothetical protein